MQKFGTTYQTSHHLILQTAYILHRILDLDLWYKVSVEWCLSRGFIAMYSGPKIPNLDLLFVTLPSIAIAENDMPWYHPSHRIASLNLMSKFHQTPIVVSSLAHSVLSPQKEQVTETPNPNSKRAAPPPLRFRTAIAVNRNLQAAAAAEDRRASCEKAS